MGRRGSWAGGCPCRLSGGRKETNRAMAAFNDGLLEGVAGSLEAAPSIWGGGGDRDAGAQQQPDGLVPLNQLTLTIIRMGVRGPAPCTASSWIAAFAVGMLAGVWLGVELLPCLRMPVSGGWFACVCVMCIHLFRKELPLLRVEVGEGGHLMRLLSSSTSPACAKTVTRASVGLRWLQGLFVLSQVFAYFYSLELVADEEWMRPDLEVSMVIFLCGFTVGSFMLVSMILSIVCSCEVLDDRLVRLTVQAKSATTMEQLRTVSFSLRELDDDVQQSVAVLRPIVMTVSARLSSHPRLWLAGCSDFAVSVDVSDALQVVAFNMSVAGCLLMQGIEAVFAGHANTERLPPAFFFGTAVAYAALNIFGVLRSPFDITAKIDVLNESFNKQRELRTSGSSNGSDTTSSIGEQLDEVDPEAGIGRVQRVTRVQWLKQPPQTMVVPCITSPGPGAVGGDAAAADNEHSHPELRCDAPPEETTNQA